MRFILWIGIFLNSLSYGNSQELSGNIKNASGEPIAEALIFTKSGAIHAHTDILGNFISKGMQIGDTVTISYLGYKTVTTVLTAEDFESPMLIIMESEPFELDQINITNSLRTPNQVTNIDLATNPVNSSQDLLRRVPGLIIGQHAGGGKAEQIFLRGFDIDHGTDITIGVDGLPVNMVSHAHGQGYSDLHFLIPETVEKIDFGKGPYYTEIGNFNTAGYVNFQTKDRIDRSIVGMEIGRFNMSRLFSMIDLFGNQEGQSAYLASEFILTDGPFESPQNFNRVNIMGKYVKTFESNDRLRVTMSRFQSKWDASGQIPQRLVDNGTITRFGAVDDTEGGFTDRTNVLIDFTKVLSSSHFLKSKAYYSKYDFELYSNFTFFLEDPINSDQIRQKENRNIYGLETIMYKTIEKGNTVLEIQTGAGLRYDDVDNNELTWTINRQQDREAVILGNVDEVNMYGFAEVEFDWNKFLLITGLRLDYFDFNYTDLLASRYQTLSQNKAFVSPKLNFIYNPNRNIQFYIKSGIGFHSNDTRTVLQSGADEVIPAAIGVDIGTTWKPGSRLWLNAALWTLRMEQEFVYVGDAGIVEPSGKTSRKGVELALRYQLMDNVFFDSDVTYTHARSIDEPEGADRIPLAPEWTASGGLSVAFPDGFAGGLRYKFIKDRPANEDNSIIAEGWFIIDANINYSYKNIGFGISVENLLNSEWNEAQFATESRLRNETESIEELHFTPGTPFNLRGKVTYSF